MHRRPVYIAAAAAAALSLSAYTFGGWAVITVDDVPEYLTVGQPVKVSFAVRQHGVRLAEGLRPTVVATNGKSEVTASASSPSTGRYAATLTVPSAGPWTITVNSGFGKAATKLHPVPALAAGEAPPAPTAAPLR